MIDAAEVAVAHGFCSYFDLQLLNTEQVIGQIRVDWSLENEGLISLQRLPSRPGRCDLCGGPLRSSYPAQPAEAWLDALFSMGRLERAEAQTQANRTELHDWWLAAVRTQEGVNEVDSHGAALGLALARLWGSCHAMYESKNKS